MTEDKYPKIRAIAVAILKGAAENPYHSPKMDGTEQEIYDALVQVHETVVAAVREEVAKVESGAPIMESVRKIGALFREDYRIKIVFPVTLVTPEWAKFCKLPGIEGAMEEHRKERIAEQEGKTP